MLSELPHIGARIALVSGSGIQFVDFGFDIEAEPACLYQRLFRRLAGTGEVSEVEGEADATESWEGWKALTGAEGIFLRRIDAPRAVDEFLERWIPLPVFRFTDDVANGTESYDQGPANWCRMWLTRLDRPDAAGNSHRLVLAFDTRSSPHPQGWDYTAPSDQDIKEGARFGLVGGAAELKRFMAAGWVSQWLASIPSASRDGGGEPWKVEADRQVLYASLLGLLRLLSAIPEISFIDTVAARRTGAVVDVDLVIDVGNSRTCGVLCEARGDVDDSLNHSNKLLVRNLSAPHLVHGDPFPSRIEFSRAWFGDDVISRRSGRNDAFSWPSVARIGHEAQALSRYLPNPESSTGLSSPKRYIWDSSPQLQQWRFNPGTCERQDWSPVTKGTLVAALRHDGEAWSEGDPLLTSAMFSRSSLMTFFLVELLLQALAQINSPAERVRRGRSTSPRRLRRVVMTMPTAMPQPERRIYEKRARMAVDLVWRVLNQTGEDAPVVQMEWDEATGTQVAFLYNEARRNFLGDLATLFATLGRRRDDDGSPSLRIANIDIGGGTTDLIVTTFRGDGANGIRPTQEFREGFNKAGDDIVARVIETVILPELLEAMSQAGAKDAAGGLDQLMGQTRAGQTHHHQVMRRQFANQVCAPLALAVVERFERAVRHGGDQAIAFHLGDVVPTAAVDPQVTAYVEAAIRDNGGAGFSLAKIEIQTTAEVVDGVIRQTLGSVLAAQCDTVHAYDCDVLLLSGMPSRLPTIRSIVMAALPVRVDRIIPMSGYPIGDWYPYRDGRQRISDPKTTASVGALICALSEGSLPGFHLYCGDMKQAATANFVGVMEAQTDRILAPNLLLAPGSAPGSAATQMKPPFFIGFRQLPTERWPVSALYHVSFTEATNAKGLQPLTIRFARGAEPLHLGEVDLVGVTGPDGTELGTDMVRMRLKTLRADEGYWTDTGIFETPRLAIMPEAP